MNGNPGYACNNTGGEMITSIICPFMKFTLDSIRNKLWKNFNTGWRKVLMMMTSSPGNEGVSDFARNEGCQINKKVPIIS